MIRPRATNADGTVAVRCDHCNAETTTTPQRETTPRGTIDTHTLRVDCTSCGSATWHPITGDGSCREQVHAMFSACVSKDGCPCGFKATDQADAEAHVMDCVAEAHAAFNGAEETDYSLATIETSAVVAWRAAGVRGSI
ncbi:MAG: hypothetical protein HYX52_05690 [Chloroflexi bacterium]|nr:hypothetical protein [Chloroflexota bacterium]